MYSVSDSVVLSEVERLLFRHSLELLTDGEGMSGEEACGWGIDREQRWHHGRMFSEDEGDVDVWSMAVAQLRWRAARQEQRVEWCS